MGQFWTLVKMNEMYWNCFLEEFLIKITKNFWLKTFSDTFSRTVEKKVGPFLDSNLKFVEKMKKE